MSYAGWFTLSQKVAMFILGVLLIVVGGTIMFPKSLPSLGLLLQNYLGPNPTFRWILGFFGLLFGCILWLASLFTPTRRQQPR
jgi:hypothetical protein